MHAHSSTSTVARRGRERCRCRQWERERQWDGPGRRHDVGDVVATTRYETASWGPVSLISDDRDSTTTRATTRATTMVKGGSVRGRSSGKQRRSHRRKCPLKPPTSFEKHDILGYIGIYFASMYRPGYRARLHDDKKGGLDISPARVVDTQEEAAVIYDNLVRAFRPPPHFVNFPRPGTDERPINRTRKKCRNTSITWHDQQVAWHEKKRRQQAEAASTVEDLTVGDDSDDATTKTNGTINATKTAAVVVVERRMDPDDGGWYTREEFVAFYGGTTEWNAARPACTQCARCHGA